MECAASECLMAKGAFEVRGLKKLDDKVANDCATHMSMLSHGSNLIHMQLSTAAIMSSELHTAESAFQWLNEVGRYHALIAGNSSHCKTELTKLLHTLNHNDSSHTPE